MSKIQVNLTKIDLKEIENKIEELYKGSSSQDVFNEKFNQTFPQANCTKLPANLAKASSLSLLKKFVKLSDEQLYDVVAKIVYLMKNEDAKHLVDRLINYMSKADDTRTIAECECNAEEFDTDEPDNSEIKLTFWQRLKAFFIRLLFC